VTIELDFLPQTAFAFLMVFARIGAISMALPGIGDRTVPPRVRLVFALSLSLIMLPLMLDLLPTLPRALNAMAAALVGELLIGLAIGFAVRLIISVIQIAGMAIASQTGLAFAQSVDPTLGSQGTMVSSFLAVLAVAMIFATDLHHLMLKAMYDSYTLFKPGTGFPSGDFAHAALDTVETGFRVAVQLAAPFLVFGLIFYLGLGVLTRLIPQVQVFFVAMPANIAIGFILLLLLIGTLMMWFLEFFAQALQPFLL